jgi:septal ring factor EnvC (AmiA/AmiB activator)
MKPVRSSALATRSLGVALAVVLAAGLAKDGRAAPGVREQLRAGASIAQPVPGGASPALELAALDRKIADLDLQEQAAKKELSGLGPRIAEAHARTLARGRAFYRLTRAGMLPVGGGFDALVTHALHVERARRVLAADLTEEKNLRARGGELSRAIERDARDRVALSTQRAAMDAARAAALDEQRRQAAFDRAFESSVGASGAGGMGGMSGGLGGTGYVAVYGANGGVSERSGSFASSKGRLLFPLAGRAEVMPARREGTDGPGLEIHGALGTAVRAVFAGRVAFADRYGAYGRLVILDHGDHYYSVAGNLAAVDVKVGDEVSAGERIGTVGDEGKGPMLYFEIRHGTDTLAPGPWLGL